MKTEDKSPKKYCIELTKEQIAIIKAGLQYYWLADDYGYALWGTMPGACFGSSDSFYRFKVGEIYGELKKISRAKPDYGWWGDIKRIAKLCKADYKIAKKEGEEAEKRMYEDAVLDESLEKEIEKHGLNGREILNKAYKSCREKLEVDKANLHQVKRKNRAEVKK